MASWPLVDLSGRTRLGSSPSQGKIRVRRTWEHFRHFKCHLQKWEGKFVVVVVVNSQATPVEKIRP